MSLSSSPLITAAALSRSATAFAFSLIAVSALGAGSFGYFSVVWAFAAATLGFMGGFNTALIAKLVEMRGSTRSDALRLTNGVGVLFSAAALLVALGGLAIWRGGVHVRLPVEIYAGTGLMLGFQLVSSFGCAALEGFGRLRAAVLLPLIGVTINMLILLLLRALGHPLELPRFLAVCATGLAVETLVTLCVAWRMGVLRPQMGASWSGVHRLLASGTVLQASGLVGFLLDPLSKAALLSWLGPAAVALFDLAMKIGWGLHSAFTAYTRLFLQIAPGDHAARIESFAASAKHVWTTSLLCASLILIWCSPLLANVTGAKPALAASVLLLALLAVLTMVWAAPPYVSLIGLGAYGFVLRNQLLLAAGNAIGAFGLVPLLGITGILWGLLAAALANAVLLWREIRRRVVAFEGFAALCAHRVGRMSLCAALLLCAWAIHQFDYQPLPVLIAASVPVLVLLALEPWTRYVVRRLAGSHV